MVNAQKLSPAAIRGILSIIIIVILFITVSSSASALGVTPARTTVGFEPGLERTVKFTVVNSEYKDMRLKIFVRGDLNESISVDEDEFELPANVESKEMEYTFTLPDSLGPGPHTADIIIYEIPEGAPASEAYVGASVAVITQLIVNVPYPGKYAQAQLNVINAQQNGQATFIIPMISLGDEDINNAHAIISIYDQSGDKIDQFQTESISLPAGGRGELVSKWYANVPLGRYLAKAHVIYSGGVIDLEKEFAVGNETLELKQVRVQNFQLGGIAKFEMLIENKWSEPIIGAYAQTQVFDQQKDIIADFKSPTYDIPPLSNSTFVSYWDTAGVEEGTYDTSVYMRYGSKFSQQNIQLRITEDEIVALGLGFVISENTRGGSNLVSVLVVVIVVLVLMNILWFMVLRKKLKKR